MRLFFFLTALALAKGPDWLVSQRNQTFTVSGKKLQAVFKNGPMTALSSLVFKILPNEKGEIFFNVTSVKPNGVAEGLGIQAGDTLKTLNGRAASLELFIKKDKLPKEWDNQKKYTLLIERSGKPETLTYIVEK